MVTPAPTPPGMRTFLTVWAGQLVSVLGSSMTGFAVTIWIYVETGSVTQLALASLAYAIPAIAVAPLAGSITDRSDRRLMMLGADTVAAALTAGMLVLYLSDSLAVWHIYIAVAIGAVAGTFQSPAWFATIPLIVPKAQLGRANGLGHLTGGVATIASPVLAGILLTTLDLGAVLIVDLATFGVAVVTLLIVRLPRPVPDDTDEPGSIRTRAIAGWRWVRERPGLLGVLIVVAGVNFTLDLFNVLLFPLVLSFASEASAGTVLSIGGVGTLLGSVAVSTWGGPKGRVRGLMFSLIGIGLLVSATGVRASVGLIAAAVFGVMLLVPIANTSSSVLWQLKVPPAIQGRVYAVRHMVANAISPIAIISAGPLADHIFEPLLAADGALASSVGSVIGTGPGRGIGFIYVLAGLLMAAIGAIGYALPRIRNVETDLPDHVVEP